MAIPPGPANLETLDTLITAGIADDRADAIRWVLTRFRQQPEYEQLRERVRSLAQVRFSGLLTEDLAAAGRVAGQDRRRFPRKVSAPRLPHYDLRGN